MSEARGANFRGDFLKLVDIRDLLFDDSEPAEPFGFIRVGPERSVTIPEALDFVVGFPVFERGLYGRGEILRQAVESSAWTRTDRLRSSIFSRSRQEAHRTRPANSFTPSVG